MKAQLQCQRISRPPIWTRIIAGMLVLAIVLIGGRWEQGTPLLKCELLAVLVLLAGWLVGPILGALIGGLAGLFLIGNLPFHGEISFSSLDPFITSLVFFCFLGVIAGWAGRRARLFSKLSDEKLDKVDAEDSLRVAELEKANAALQADIIKHKQTEIALRRSEAYLAEAERLSHTGSWAYDVATGVPVYWSLERCRISQFDPAKGHPSLEEYRQLHTPEDWEKLMETFQRAIRDQTDFQTDSREVHVDGSSRYLHIVGHPVRNAAGKVVELVGSTMDMTERKRTEDALHRAQAHLNQITHLTTMGELAASIAHEVNQPLAAIVTNADACLRWLDHQPPDLQEARDAVSRIIRDGNRGSDVIVRIRALLKKEPPANVRLNVNEVIREILALSQARLRGIRVRTDLAEDLPTLLADRVQLQQVLLNLITNAVDAMKPVSEHPRVLQIQTRLQMPRMVLVTVQDSGVGIAADHLAQLFEPFYTTKPQGLGMGLSISRSIIEAHGGRLWAESALTGAMFHFTLPLEDHER